MATLGMAEVSNLANVRMSAAYYNGVEIDGPVLARFEADGTQLR
jgi:hypothetical protein